MDHTKMPMSEVLTPDEKLVADFIKTRTKKVLDDIQRLSKEQNADISEWAESFAYLARTYGRDSDETFKWFKYYFREGMIPANVALPLVVQVYLDSSVDGGFVNTFAKAFKQEPEDVRNQRIEDMKQELAEYIDSDGNLTVYRGSFERCIRDYITDRLAGRDDLDLRRVFITHSGVSPEIEALAEKTVRELQPFEEVCITRAGCTVSSHCGPGTLGVLFIEK